MKKTLKINRIDNVIVALENIEKGDLVGTDGEEIKVTDDIRMGHKVAVKRILKGEDGIKYGYPIGKATADIEVGELVHSHNLETKLGKIAEYKYDPKLNDLDCKKRDMYFEGFKRSSGQVGIRNELWIVPTVVCINSVGDQIIQEFRKTLDPVKADAVAVLKHTLGCGQSDEDLLNTQKILSNIVKHPNAGGVLVLGLGCEDNHIEEMRKILGDYDTDRIKFLNSQDVEDEVADGVAILKELYETMKDDKREKTHISELKIGTECGGSDAFSGLTGNPLVGKLSDFLICQGGTTVLTEVPEMFGAETILMERAKDEEVFKKIVKMINDYKKYLKSYNVPIYENPSYGNKEGGITTLEEKSLGCTQKSGDAPVVDVIGHNEFIKEKGLNLYDCPSDDAIEATALGAIGCQMVLFTTGRGTPLGSFVPTLKISTNSKMGTLKKKWIDFDAGRLLEEPMEDLLEDFINLIIDTANGKMAKNEINDSREVSIWKIGPTV